MNFIEAMLSQSLQNKNPQLDPQGTDRRVLNIACQDFVNFLKVFWRLVGQETAELELTERIDKYFHENPDELQEFVNLWSGIWMKKWNERVKLLLEDENSERWRRMHERLLRAEPVWRQLTSRHEMGDMVIETLVKNGEICGTSILAENLLKIEIASCLDRKTPIHETAHLLNVVNRVLRQARQLCQSKGPLIFVRVDKRFFQFSQPSR